MEKSEVILAIKQFEKCSTTQGYSSNPKFTESMEVLMNFGIKIVNPIGKYLQNTKVTNEQAWCMLLLGLTLKNAGSYPAIPPSDFNAWKKWSVAQYNENLESYTESAKKADEYMQGFGSGSLSYNNSAHRSSAVQKYQSCLTEAEMLLDEEKIEKAKNKIHFLQTA